MKRILSLVLAVLMIFGTVAVAELPDISGLSPDELEELKKQVIELTKKTLPNGEYVVGTDIKAGTYVFHQESEYKITDFEDEDLYEDITEASFYVYKLTDEGKYKCIYTDYITPGKSLAIEIHDGEKLSVNDFTGYVDREDAAWWKP